MDATTQHADTRFSRKRDAILDAASVQIERHGLKGLTFVAVADAVGLNTTSITYYFKRKDLLAAATLQRGIDQLSAIVAAGNQATSPQGAIRAVLAAQLHRVAQVRAGKAQPVTLLSDMRALDAPSRNALTDAYRAVVWQLAAHFGPMPDTDSKARNLARAQIVMEIIHWSRISLTLYSEADFPRVLDRLMDLLEQGIAPDGAGWTPEQLSIDTDNDTAPEAYLRAATLLLNERGYRGASVTRIAAQLNLSKGSFYHHLQGKDDLVLACFDRSYSRVSQTQRMAIALDGDCWHQLTTAIATLLHVQFTAEFPLLRTTALQVLPQELRPTVLQRSDRMARRFAGMMIDGITQGSIRAIDPLIASQCLMAALNAAGDFTPWAAQRGSVAEAARIYAAPLAYGFFD
ncbi:MAG: TetR/AcrR family transcriptional regulator [Paracoccaceae bacterium]